MKTHISDRAFEIVESVIYHGSKKEAAEALNRSLYTVETTIKNVYDHLGLNKISDLTLWFCGVKFGIADQVAAFKNIALILGIFFLVSVEGLNNDLIQPRRYSMSPQNIGNTRTRKRRKERAISIINNMNNYEKAC